ncbi:MAG: hypothetical protein R3E79_54990 [Caldilineaceae bacterium]
MPTTSQAPFTEQSLLSVSEIGMATPNVRDFCHQLHTTLGLERWRGNDTNFAAVGDEEGLFIVAVNGRPWNGNESPAQPADNGGITWRGREDGGSCGVAVSGGCAAVKGLSLVSSAKT